jgi:hypothetical protein
LAGILVDENHPIHVADPTFIASLGTAVENYTNGVITGTGKTSMPLAETLKKVIDHIVDGTPDLTFDIKTNPEFKDLDATTKALVTKFNKDTNYKPADILGYVKTQLGKIAAAVDADTPK